MLQPADKISCINPFPLLSVRPILSVSSVFLIAFSVSFLPFEGHLIVSIYVLFLLPVLYFSILISCGCREIVYNLLSCCAFFSVQYFIVIFTTRHRQGAACSSSSSKIFQPSVPMSTHTHVSCRFEFPDLFAQSVI